ncbi:probable WRKY transcription factor 3 isoform X1 [Amaranthus tricolor]|uniref:probable WRKY transcription factor 3 isoform X1 n=1 Tax=Amaranthus tricolor TaxID=29722 RepID=UPI00258D248B|nr:probable WRKY transcription factor 3 isoform X1 [Amaranthus tricolor]
MAENDPIPSTKPPQPQRPTITLPSRAGIESLFSGSGFGLSPGPMTLVSSFFSENDPDSDCRSFSQLLAGAIASPKPPSEPDQLRFKDNRPPGLVISQPQPQSQVGVGVGGGFFLLSPGVSPALLLDSPGLFPGQGPFGMSHQQALAQVTAQAQAMQQAQQGSFQSSTTIGGSEPNSAFAPELEMQQKMMSSASESKETEEPAQFSGSDQKLQSSSIIVDKPADDGYNWRKYGQKQVKGSEFPRSYYKCTHTSCPVRKKVERSLDGQVTEIIYKGQHNHQPPQKKSKDGGNPNGNLGNQGNSELGSQLQPNNMNRISDGMARSLSRRDQESSQATADQPSSDEEEMDNDGTKEAAGDEDERDAKRRNTEVRVTEQAASHRTVTEPKIVVQTTSEVDLLDDGYRWRKYGQKVVKGNPYPRSYYKCTHPGCNVRKQVERAPSDPKAVVTTYEGKHNHDIPAARMSSHNTTNSSSHLRPHKTEFANTREQPVATLRLKEERIT